MSFFDEATIHLQAGNGGNGCLSFRREKFIEFGGPNGGNGGKGGDILIKVDNNLKTLFHFAKKNRFKAENGKDGQSQNCFGAAGKNLTLNVPRGTQIFDESGENLFYDLDQHDSEFLLVCGGRGGLGNNCFKSSRNQSPRKFTNGEKGQENILQMKLKLLSDVGLVGLPNVGKSTIVSMCTNSKTKIANYAFTTLKPALGVVEIGYQNFIIADLPGLIVGASQGRGLGLDFLKHVERCEVLLHVLAADSKNILQDYLQIKDEINAYSHTMQDKQEIIVLSKVDLISEEDLENLINFLQEKLGKKIYITSVAHKKNLMQLMEEIFYKHFAKKTVDNDFLKFSPIDS